MTELIFPPSPNWYLSNVITMTCDGSIIYGCSLNNISILTPIENATNNQRFNVKCIHPAHKARVTCVAACPNWTTTRHFVSGSEDGILKLWNADTDTFAIAHNIHLEAKEVIVGAVFLNERDVVSIGYSGVVVLWNTKLNTVQVNNKIIRTFKPVSIALCPHKQNVVAVGTKQGVVIVLSLGDKFSIIFKAHGHDTDVTSLCWCPTLYCEPLEKLVAMKRPKIKTNRIRKLSNRKSEIRNGPGSDDVANDKSLLNSSEFGLYDQTSGEEADESDIFDVHKDHLCKDGYTGMSDSDKDYETIKYSLPRDVSKENLSDTASAVETGPANSSDGGSQLESDSKKSEHNAKFLEECKKLQEFMSSKKSLTNKHLNNSFLLNDSIQSADDSIVENVTITKFDNTLNESQINPADASDIFDIYTEPSFYEFGHSKYIPGHSDNEDNGSKDSASKRNIESKADKNNASESFEDELQKLQELMKSRKIKEESEDRFEKKGETLDRSKKTETDTTHAFDSDDPEEGFEDFNEVSDLAISIEGDNMQNKSVDDISNVCNDLKNVHLCSEEPPAVPGESSETQTEAKDRGNYFFLSSACKNGKVCIWRWGGNLVSSGSIMLQDKTKSDKAKKAGHPWGVICWPTTKILFTSTKSAELLRCNFHSIYGRSKSFGMSLLHGDHFRGLYSIISRVNSKVEDDWRTPNHTPLVWSVGQDRLLISYSFDEGKVVSKFTTFGGYVYDIAVSPIDPTKFAIGAGDGMIRIWEYSPNCKQNDGLGIVNHFWQNVQGKVQSCAWNPTKEDMVAFANSEGRVGLINASAVSPAKVLPSGLPLGAFNVCWGQSHILFASGGGQLVVYNINHPNTDPNEIEVSSMGRKWNVSAISWTEEYLCVGSIEGALGLLQPDHPYNMITSAYPHRKPIKCISWHPIAVSNEDGLSPFGDLVAISSNSSPIVIMKLIDDECGVKLETYEELNYHSQRVNKLSWSPHCNGRLLSASDDGLLQVYDLINKQFLHTLVGHRDVVLCGIWSPVDSNIVISTGGDHTLRVWDLNNHPYREISPIKQKNKRKMKLALQTTSDVIASKEGSFNKPAVIKQTKVKEQEVERVEEEDRDDNDDEDSEEEDEVTDKPMATKTIPQKEKSVRMHSFLSLMWKQIKETDHSVEGCRRLFRHHIAKSNNQESTVDYTNGYDYLRIFGSSQDVTELIDIEQQKYEETLSWRPWVKLGLLKGDTKTVLEKAKEKSLLCLSMLSLAPSVSNRFWREMLSAYTEQLKEKCIKGESYLGSDMAWHVIIWRTVVLLSCGEVEEACTFLATSGLAGDAVAAAHAHRADHLVPACLHIWIKSFTKQQKFAKVAECYVALGQLMDAALALGHYNDEDALSLSAEIAKFSENKSLSDGITKISISDKSST